MKIDARFGVALFPDHAQDLDGLLAEADRALAEAKRHGGPVIRLASGAGAHAPLPPSRATHPRTP